jgi:hypothetical protein
MINLEINYNEYTLQDVESMYKKAVAMYGEATVSDIASKHYALELAKVSDPSYNKPYSYVVWSQYLLLDSLVNNWYGMRD